MEKNQHIDNIDKIFLLILEHGIFFHLVAPRFHLGFEIPYRSIAYILRFVYISPSSPSSSSYTLIFLLLPLPLLMLGPVWHLQFCGHHWGLGCHGLCGRQSLEHTLDEDVEARPPGLELSV